MADSAGFSLHGRRVWVAGHRGMVGSAVVRRLVGLAGETITVDRARCDLTRQAEVEGFLREARPEAVFVCAATVGGIAANAARPVDFLYENLMIEANIIRAAHEVGVDKLLFLGSSCIYPKFAEQPITEASLLTGPLEPTNQWYAIAKIVGLKLCEAYRRQHGADYISAMPTNLYGPGDNFDLEASHVIPALLRKAHEARRESLSAMQVWGSGSPRREFLHVDDLADALVFLMERYSGEETVNVGTGEDITIGDLAHLVAATVGYTGRLEFDASRPDGTPRKLLDVSKLSAMGWRARTSLEDGLAETYDWFLAHEAQVRGA